MNKIQSFLIVSCIACIAFASCTKTGKEKESVTAAASKSKIYMDISHGQKFWNDPANMDGMDTNQIERVKYMTAELLKNASAVDAELLYFKEKITAEQLADCDLLFIHIPSLPYSKAEVKAITQYLDNGGSLFLVMDTDYWSTLQQTNVNDLISPYDIRFGSPSPDTLSGGYTKTTAITPNPLKITYHGGRIVEGGNPFCYNNQTEEYPFGIFSTLENGGKIVLMGDGMTSLYMTSWNGVDDYQCHEFMHHVLQWLLE